MVAFTLLLFITLPGLIVAIGLPLFSQFRHIVPHWPQKYRRAISILFVILLGLRLLSLSPVVPASAAMNLTIVPLIWNVIGLDSNNVNVGPNQFPVGARVCNTGDTTAINVISNFVWDSVNANINAAPGSPSSLSIASLDAGVCTDVYYNSVCG